MDVNISEHFDFERLNVLLEGFNQATGFVTAILDLEGNVLSKSGWRKVCTDFHRVNKESAKNCKKSDVVLANKMSKGEDYYAYKCLNGLIDVVVPIVIKGEHFANLYTGQFFFEEPSMDFFKKQAKQYNFDENSYLSAVKKVPVVSETKVKDIMKVLIHIIKMISDLTVEKMEQQKLNSLLEVSYKEIKSQKQRLTNIIEGADVGTWEWNLQTGEIICNQKYEEILGYKLEEFDPITIKTWKKFTHPEDLKKAKKMLAKHFDGEIDQYKTEIRMKHKDGNWIWLQAQGKVITWTEDSKPEWVYGTHQNITKKKTAEEELKASEEKLKKEKEKLRTTLNSIGDAVISTDIEGRLVRMNPIAERLTGWNWKDVRGNPIHKVFNIINAKTRKRVKNPVNEVLEKGKIVGLANHTKLIAKDGREYHIADSASPIKDEKGNIYGVVLVFRNVTKEYNLRSEIKNKAQIFSNAVEEAPFPIMLYNDKGKVLNINKVWQDITGYSKEEIPTINDWIEKAYDKNKDSVKEFINNFDNIEARRDDGEFIIKTKDDNYRTWDFKTAKIGSDENRNDMLISMAVDITKRIQSKRELRNKERDYKQLVENSPIGIFKTNYNGEIKMVNLSMAKILGFENVKEVYKHYDDVKKDLYVDNNRRKTFLKKLIRNGEVKNFVYRVRDKAGKIIWIEENARISSKDNRDNFIIEGFIMDITERKEHEKQMTYMNFHDNLTGLYNRTYIEDMMKRIDTKRNLPISLIMGDLNNLKLINDSYGHSKGDEVIKKAAEIIKDICRKEDVVARWGGDEIVVLLPQTSIKESEQIIKRINSNNLGDDLEYPSSIALGAAAKKDEKEDIFKVLDRAENRMYTNKFTNKNSRRSDVLTGFLNTLKEKSYETESHVNRMTDISAVFANKLNLSNEIIDELYLLSLLHDIGKITVPEKILNKEEKLTKEEWEIIKTHPEAGYRILKDLPRFSHIAEAVLHHHERWDGSGYPKRLKGKEIPLLARILTIVDSYDVMISGRPYQEAMSIEEISEEFKRCSGTQFDPELVDVFIEIIDNDKFISLANS